MGEGSRRLADARWTDGRVCLHGLFDELNATVRGNAESQAAVLRDFVMVSVLRCSVLCFVAWPVEPESL